ncbi:hypothetical protein BJY00DRAFT_311437 [Aspergillus carlsbadensis]|nr:hypothetical protein BJY00DRAFT_311437 [Aspergillus carlsbadensis]
MSSTAGLEHSIFNPKIQDTPVLSQEPAAVEMNAASPAEHTVSILELPPELLDEICSYISVEEHGFLRLACRYLYLGMKHSYYTNALTIVKTDLSTKSLRCLEWIISDEFRASFVKELSITYEREFLEADGIAKSWSHNTNETTSILDLPPELLDHIARYLSLEEHGVCRLACQYLYRSTWGAYARKAVDVLVTDLSTNSLAELAKVARDPRNAPYVEHLFMLSIDAVPSNDQAPDGTRRPWLWEECTGRILPQQPNEQQLEEILRRLLTCQTFTMGATTRPAGGQERFGHPPDLGSLVMMRCFDSPGCLSQFRGLYSNLEVLAVQPFHLGPDNFLFEILPHAPKLRVLRLDGCKSGLTSPGFSTPIPFQLQELKLYSISALDGASLLSFIRHHSATLKRLDFFGLELDPSGPGWSSIFRSLAPNLSSLESLDLSSLRRRGDPRLDCFKFPGHYGPRFSFPCDKPCGEGALCKAPSVRAVLERIAGNP